MRFGGKSLIRWLSGRTLRLSLSVGLLVFLISQLDIPLSFAVLADARLDLLVLLILVLLIIRGVGAVRWYVLLRGRHVSVSLSGIVRLMFVSDFMGYLTPGNLGVELLRVYGWARTTADTALAATSVLVERILAFFAILALVLAGLAFRPPELPLEIMYTAWLGCVLLILALGVLMVPRLRRGSLLLLPGTRLARVRSVTERVFLTLDEYRRQPGLMLCSLGLAVLFQLLRCVQAAVGAAALGVHLPFVVYVVIIPIIVLLTLLPISIGGLGVREAGFVYFFGLVGMPPEVAFSLSLMMQVCALLLTLPGAWFYMRRGVYA